VKEEQAKDYADRIWNQYALCAWKPDWRRIHSLMDNVKGIERALLHCIRGTTRIFMML